ncbi:ABC transporter permease [Granulicella pectinivorans]|nr:ABC transporter permease [Granulicella pectinivorans]
MGCEEMMSGLWQDVKYGVRQMMRSPGFTVTAILTLALGIGANTAIFTVFNQVLLRMLPVEKPEELQQVTYTGTNMGRMSVFGGDSSMYFSYPMYKKLRDKNEAFRGLFANVETSVGVLVKNESESVDTEMVSGNYFQVLGVPAAAGRTLLPSDDVVKNGSPVVVLSDAFWKAKFAGDKGVVGSTLLVNGQPFTVVGVAPAGFSSAINGFRPKLFVPITMRAEVNPGLDDLDDERSMYLNVVGRLKPGVSAAAATAGLTVLWKQLRAEELARMHMHSAKFADRFVAKSEIKLVPDAKGFSPLRDQLQTPLKILMGMVLLLAAMTCMNLANLLMVRGAGRTREFAVRFALGAARGRIVQQMLVEGVVLGGLGGAIGLALAPTAATFLVRKITDSTGETAFKTMPDAWVLGFTLVLSLGISVLFSLAPAWQMMKPDMVESLKTKAGGMLGGAQRFRTAAIALQIGLSVLLLSGAGLFVRTLHQLKGQDMGLSTDHLVEFSVDTTLSGIPTTDTVAYQSRVRAALQALPGVKAVGGTTDQILAGNSSQGNITVEGYQPAPDENMDTEVAGVTPGYREALGISLLAGRDFTEADAKGAPKVAMINRSLAVKYFGSVEKALGHMITQGGGDKVKLDTQIVGVVADTKMRGVRAGTVPFLMQPFDQVSHGMEGMEYYVKTTQAPEAAENMIRGAVHGVDPKLIADSMKTMDEQIDSNISNERMIALLAACFAMVALLTTAVGLYGVLAFATAQRTREIGIRMALGAQRWGVVRMVLGDMAKVAGVGIVVALPVSVAVARQLKSQMFEVSAFDPITMAGCVVVTGVMVLVAAAIPARRAATVEPTEALRTE